MNHPLLETFRESLGEEDKSLGHALMIFGFRNQFLTSKGQMFTIPCYLLSAALVHEIWKSCQSNLQHYSFPTLLNGFRQNLALHLY
jgi:hypothetical protein